MGEMFEAVMAIIFDNHLIYRYELLKSPELFKATFIISMSPDFEILVMFVFIIHVIILEMDRTFQLLIFIS